MRVFNILFLIFIIFTITPPVVANDTSRIAAVVNNKMISESDLEARVKLAIISSGMEYNETNKSQLKPQILKLMIDEELKLQEAEKYEVQIAQENIDIAFKGIEQANNMPEGELKNILESNNISLDVMYHHLRSNLAWQEYVRGRYQSSVTIGEGEIDRALEDHKLSISSPQDLVAEIFLTIDSPDQDESIKQQALELINNMKKGARFSVLAEQFSTSASAARGGDIGWVRRGSLDPAVNDALATMTVGDVTETPVRTQNGYYILMLRDHREAGESPEKKSLISFKQALYPINLIKTQQDFESAMAKMKSLSQNARSCGLFSKFSENYKAIKVQDVKDVPSKSLMPQLQEILGKLEEEKASDPIPSDVGIICFMVCERKEIDPKDPTRDDMRIMLIEQKLNLLSQREIRNIRRASFIDIRV